VATHRLIKSVPASWLNYSRDEVSTAGGSGWVVSNQSTQRLEVSATYEPGAGHN
jgi:hypothetical protein